MNEITGQYADALRRSYVFNNIPVEKQVNVLSCLQVRKMVCQRDELLFAPGQADKRAGVVLTGALDEFLYDEEGNQIILAHLESGAVFGAEFICADQLVSPIYLRATQKSDLLLLDFTTIFSKRSVNCPYRMQVMVNLMEEYARQIAQLNTKIRILSQKKLRDKLKIFFQTQQLSADGVITLPFNRREMADYLCADRSALSRELCRMRDDGILTFAGRTVTILDKPFLFG